MEVGGFLKTTFDEVNIFALFVSFFVWCCWNKLTGKMPIF